MTTGVEELRLLLCGLDNVHDVVVVTPSEDTPDVPSDYIGFRALHMVKNNEIKTGLYRSPEFIANPENHQFLVKDMREAIEARREELAILLGKDGVPVVP